MKTSAVVLALFSIAAPSAHAAPANHAPTRHPHAVATSANSAGSTSHEAVPFIEDDFATAVALAKARGVPIFVDAWAPW